MSSLALVCADELIATYRLDKPAIVVGRSEECDITLSGPLVSRKHCRFVADGNTYVVEDLGSHNGTHLNGKRVERQTLTEGDRIAVVPHILVFHASDMEPIAAPAVPAPPADGVPSSLMATAAVDIGEVNRRLAKLQVAPEPRSPGVSHETIGRDVDLLRVSGLLDDHAAAELGKTIAGLLSKGRCKIVVDLTEAGALANKGVAILLWASDRARERAGSIVLLDPGGHVQRMMDRRLAQVLAIASNRQEALSLF